MNKRFLSLAQNKSHWTSRSYSFSAFVSQFEHQMAFCLFSLHVKQSEQNKSVHAFDLCSFAENHRRGWRNVEQSSWCDVGPRAVLRSLQQILPHHREPRFLLQGCTSLPGLCRPQRPPRWGSVPFGSDFRWLSSGDGSKRRAVVPTETEKQERAFTLGLAGLLGEGVYNFGELVRFPLLLITCALAFTNLTRQNVS